MEKIHYDVNIPVPSAPVLLSGFEENGDGLNSSSKKRKIDEVSSVAVDLSGVTGTKVLVLPNGTSPSNKLLSELILMVKPKMKKLVEDANLVRLPLIVNLISSLHN